MAGIDTTTQVGKVEDVSDIIFNVSAEDTPFTSLIPKGTNMNQEVASFQMEKHPVAGYEGIADSSDVETFESVVRETAVAVSQEFRRAWKVSQRAEVNKVHGLGSAGERAHQKVLAMITLKKMMERCFCGSQDSRRQTGALNLPANTTGGASFRTRGAFSWLSSSAQGGTDDVPANFRPASAAVASGTTVAGVTEAAFNTLLNNMYSATEGGKKTLHGLVGTLLKAQFDSFGALADAGASFATFPVRTFNNDSADKTLIRVIDRLEFSAGTVMLHLTPFLYTTLASGAAEASTTRSGLFLKPDTWEIRFQMKPEMKELEDQGGGPRGFVRAMAALVCYNPLENTFAQAAS
jgi:hypothetical protein